MFCISLRDIEGSVNENAKALVTLAVIMLFDHIA